LKPGQSDDCSFFDYGRVTLEMCDSRSRQAMVRLCIPCCLFQTISPHLLGGGTVDELKIRDPLAVWIPKLTRERFAGPAASVDGIEHRANAAIREEVERSTKVFVHLQGHLADPSDLIPMLPLGTYVTMMFRCRVDDVIKVLEGVDSIPVVGVHEFQLALAAVLHTALSDFERSKPARHSLP